MEDPLTDNTPLCGKFPQLFSICNYQECTVNSCLAVDNNTFFRRRLTQDLSAQWNEIVTQY